MGKGTMLPSLGTTLGIGADAVSAIMDFSDSMHEGNGVLASTVQAGLGFAIPELVGTIPYLAYQAVDFAATAGVAAYENANMKLRQMDRDNRNQNPFRSHTFVDSQQIYTMRQAGMALAQQSKYRLQQTMMGNEAQFLHR